MCLVLWKGYRRDEASWVVEKDVTNAALRLDNMTYYIK